MVPSASRSRWRPIIPRLTSNYDPGADAPAAAIPTRRATMMECFPASHVVRDLDKLSIFTLPESRCVQTRPVDVVVVPRPISTSSSVHDSDLRNFLPYLPNRSCFKARSRRTR